ncbi:hypothetical protein LTR85_009904 [Meristemomyces frigidus]|nr:hypothetical protein LTR85_009904 [Meristemomyces frigidus]
MTNDTQPEQQSRLLNLPAELQLAIYELAVIEDEPLLLNCGCDSSYSGRRDVWREDKQAWKSGEKRPPCQPALTRTCRDIRADALPMFYKYNTFRAHYCYAATFRTALRWLRMIGHSNRQMLRRVVLVDANRRHDVYMPRDLATAKDLLGRIGGEVHTDEVDDYCWHRVSFPDSVVDAGYDGLEKLFGDCETPA